MTKEPVFSIATPTRNALRHLKRCVGSVKGQSGVSVEHLVQDALSDDGTQDFLRSTPGLLAVSEPDAGMYDAIQRAWSRSRGSYLAWLNSDEQYLPGTLARIEAVFRERQDVDVIFGNYIVVRADGSPVALRREIPFRPIYAANGFLYAQSCTLFFRRHLLDRGLLKFDLALHYAADHDLMLRLAAHGVRMHHLAEYLALFGIDGGNLSGHAGMLQETVSVQSCHGGIAPRWARRLVFSGRSVERLLSGAYRSQSVSYRFARDEMPQYQLFEAAALGGRYALSDALPR